jgi:nitric oxide reductase NorQ protein
MSAKKKTTTAEYNPQVYSIQEYNPSEQTYWKDISDERQMFMALFSIKRPLGIKGPTGCGKTTFVRHMHRQIGDELSRKKFKPSYSFDPETGLYITQPDAGQIPPFFPLYIIDGTEDTEVIHILGGFSHTGKYIGGPVYHWAHTGGILLVNELAEIRKDVQTAFHSALDKERTVSFPDLSSIVELPDHAMMVATWNPGYQARREPLKTSTKQRIPTLEFGYPDREVEAEIVYNASRINGAQIDEQTADKLATLAESIRSRDKGDSILANREGVSTRLLVMAAELIATGVDPAAACRTAIVQPLAASRKEAEALEEIVFMSGLKAA